MLQRIRNRLSKTVRAPGEAVSLLRCARGIRSLNVNASPRTLADFCFHYPIRPQQVPEELIHLFEIVSALQVKNALEIGTWSGGTLFMTCRVADQDATVISVDLPGGRFGGGYVWPRKFVYSKFTKNNQALHLLRRDSHDPNTRGLVRSLLRDKPLDFLFVDGDHTYSGVRADFELYAPLVRGGGIVGFHDIVKHAPQMECEVDRFWNEIKPRYRHVEIIKDPLQGWAGIGLLYI
ncbi:MAG: methyltransferase [Acidobacteria bacterium]|nr:MAG: methyltransferase [Acidobacteriota bacterium]